MVVGPFSPHDVVDVLLGVCIQVGANEEGWNDHGDHEKGQVSCRHVVKLVPGVQHCMVPEDEKDSDIHSYFFL